MEHEIPVIANKDWLTLREACGLLRRGYKAVRLLCDKNEICRDPYIRRYLISRASIEAYNRRVAAKGLAL